CGGVASDAAARLESRIGRVNGRARSRAAVHARIRLTVAPMPGRSSHFGAWLLRRDPVSGAGVVALLAALAAPALPPRAGAAPADPLAGTWTGTVTAPQG